VSPAGPGMLARAARLGCVPRRAGVVRLVCVARLPGVMRLACVVAAVAACSSKARVVEDAKSAGSGSAGSAGSGSSGAAGSSSSAGSAGSAGSGSAGAAPAANHGDVQIRVEWANVPMVARASPGRTPCNTPRSPSVAPTPTWGVPDAVVIVEGARADAGEARVVLADCALAPRAAIGASLVVESAVDRPASVLLAKRGDLAKLEAVSAAGAAGSPALRTLRLPIAGHAVAVALEPGGVYELATSAKDPETSWIVAGSGAAMVTDASGQAVLRAVPAGPHAVTAWLPPRAGQPARLARGTVTAVAGELAELTLQLAAP